MLAEASEWTRKGRWGEGYWGWFDGQDSEVVWEVKGSFVRD